MAATPSPESQLHTDNTAVSGSTGALWVGARGFIIRGSYRGLGEVRE
jgi:hypothetical protein